MCESPRHFTPGGVSLGLQQTRDVIKDDDKPWLVVLVAGQRRAGAAQNPATDLTAQNDLLAPFALAATGMHADHIDELLEQGMVFGDLRQGFADPIFDVHTQNRTGGLIRGTNSQVRLEGHHAG